MKRSILFMMAVSAIAVLSCTKEINNEIAPEKEKVTMSFDATLGAPTKVELGEAVTGGYKVLWSKDDAITIAADDNDLTSGYINGDKFTTDIAEANATAVFAGETSVADAYYALYPYNANHRWYYNNTRFSASFNTTQTADGLKNGLLVAKESDGTLQFKHVTGYVKFEIPSNYTDVTKVTFAGKADETIGGKYVNVFPDKEVMHEVTASNVATTLTLIPSEDAFTPGTYYIAALPVELNSGIVMTFTDSEGKVATKESATPAEIKAGDILNLGALSTLDFVSPVKTIPYSETFAGTQGDFNVNDVTLGDGLSYVWSTNSGYIKATAYASSTNYASESWLVSPIFDLTSVSSAFLSFEHAVNYFSDMQTAESEVLLKVKAENGDWTNVSFAFPDNLGWTFVNSGSISLADYIGKNIQVAFVYTSTATKAGTWEIRNFNIAVKQSQILSFEETNVSATLGEAFTAPVLSGAETTVTYSSDNTDVAEVANDGTVTLKAAGNATITATAAETEDYFGATASYKITVVDDSVVYLFATSQSTSNTAYASVYDVEINGLTWSVPGNQNFDGFVRIGGNSITNEVRVIYGKSPITKGVKTISMVTNGISNANLNVNSIACKVYSTADGAANGTEEDLVATITNTDNDWAVSTAKTLTFTNSAEDSWENYYYRFEFNLTNSTTKNYGVNLVRIEFCKD